MLYKNIKELIGNTPILEIDKKITGLKNIKLYVKCELFNPFGSIKDRTALALIEDDLDEIKKAKKTVIESSSGNTAKALQLLCSVNDIAFKTVSNRIKTPETKKILKIVGAEIEELPGQSECPDPSDPNDPISYIERSVGSNDDYYHTSQYTNLKNPETHCQNTGREIFEDLGDIDYFLGTLGTTGSSRGIIEYFNGKKSALKKIGIIAKKGDYIPGIRTESEMHEVGIFDASLYDQIIEIDSTRAIEGMLKLNRKVGVLGGPTSGASFQASLDYLQKIDKNLTEEKKAVFVACDRMEGYISYIQKRRPDLFEDNVKTQSVRDLTEQDLKRAQNISVAEVTDFITKENPIIVDLRGNMAYRNGHIKNAINIVDTYFDDLISSELPFSRNSKILLVCGAGVRSEKYSAFLNKQDLNTYSLIDGMFAYKEASLPMVNEIK